MNAINLKTFSPELLQHALEFHEISVVFAIVICVVGLIIKVWAASFGDVGEMLRAIGVVAIIALVIPNFPNWLNSFQTFSYNLMESFGADPSRSYERFAEIITASKEEGGISLSFWDVIWNDEVTWGEAISYGAVYGASQFALLLMFLVQFLQQILLVFGIALAPVFIAFFQVDIFREKSVKYIISVVSISLWPIGWAVGDIGTQALIDMATNGRIISEHDGFLISSLQSMFLISLLSMWIVTNTIAAPLLITKLLRDGENPGGVLMRSFGNAVGQLIASAGIAGATAHYSGGGRLATNLSAVAGAASGFVSGSMGGSGLMAATGIGAAGAHFNNRIREGREKISDYTKKAKELYTKAS